MAKFFNYILQGSDATEENAIQAARGLDWQEVETIEADYPNLQYIGTLNGVGIYYNYGTDGYYFTDEDAEDDYEPEVEDKGPFQQVDALGDLGTFGLNESGEGSKIKNLQKEYGGTEVEVDGLPGAYIHKIRPGGSGVLSVEIDNGETISHNNWIEAWVTKEGKSGVNTNIGPGNVVPLSNYPFPKRTERIIKMIFSDWTGIDYYNLQEGNNKTIQITQSQLKEIIREGVEKLHKKTIIENRINKINEELDSLNKNEDTYFETLSSALDSVRDKVERMGYELDEEGVFFHFGTGGVSYETTKSAVIDLLKDGQPILGKSGRPLNRAMNISIYRMPSGKYELTAYKTW